MAKYQTSAKDRIPMGQKIAFGSGAFSQQFIAAVRSGYSVFFINGIWYGPFPCRIVRWYCQGFMMPLPTR